MLEPNDPIQEGQHDNSQAIEREYTLNDFKHLQLTDQEI